MVAKLVLSWSTWPKDLGLNLHCAFTFFFLFFMLSFISGVFLTRSPADAVKAEKTGLVAVIPRVESAEWAGKTLW